MALPWKIIDRFVAADGATVELRQRGAGDFLIFHDGQVLMNSKTQRSEIALGRLACHGLPPHLAPRVLVGGLGMGFTLRAVLDALPAAAQYPDRPIRLVVPFPAGGGADTLARMIMPKVEQALGATIVIDDQTFPTELRFADEFAREVAGRRGPARNAAASHHE